MTLNGKQNGDLLPHPDCHLPAATNTWELVCAGGFLACPSVWHNDLAHGRHGGHTWLDKHTWLPGPAHRGKFSFAPTQPHQGRMEVQPHLVWSPSPSPQSTSATGPSFSACAGPPQGLAASVQQLPPGRIQCLSCMREGAQRHGGSTMPLGKPGRLGHQRQGRWLTSPPGPFVLFPAMPCVFPQPHGYSSDRRGLHAPKTWVHSPPPPKNKK
jgi:hypothetical protein